MMIAKRRCWYSLAEVMMMATFAHLTLKSHHVLFLLIFFIADIPRVSASCETFMAITIVIMTNMTIMSIMVGIRLSSLCLVGLPKGHDFPLQTAIDAARMVGGRHMHRHGAQVRPIPSTVSIY